MQLQNMGKKGIRLCKEDFMCDLKWQWDCHNSVARIRLVKTENPSACATVNCNVCRMPSSGMWRRVDIVWTDVSEERIASIFHLLTLVPRSRIFLHWRWMRYVPPKHRFTQDLYGATVCSHLLTLVPRSRIFIPRRWRRYVPSKRRFTQDLHGATSQKTAFFVVTAVKASNLICNVCRIAIALYYL
jgi:hypothetical protein